RLISLLDSVWGADVQHRASGGGGRGQQPGNPDRQEESAGGTGRCYRSTLRVSPVVELERAGREKANSERNKPPSGRLSRDAKGRTESLYRRSGDQPNGDGGIDREEANHGALEV